MAALRRRRDREAPDLWSTLGSAPMSDPDPSQAPGPRGPRIRRRLFGSYRASDVDRALLARDETIAELRQNVAAVWVACGCNERRVEALAARVEALGGEPPERTSPAPPTPQPMARPPDRDRAPLDADQPSGAGPEPSDPLAPEVGAAPLERDHFGNRLAELDAALASIRDATSELARDYVTERDPAEGEPRER